MAPPWNITEMLGSGPFPETIIAPTDGAEMVLVPAGDFIKGISEVELAQIYMLDKNENPVFASEVPSRIIYVKDFYIDRYPVTNYQYQKFIDATGHREPILLNHPLWGQPMKPVVFVGWDVKGEYKEDQVSMYQLNDQGNSLKVDTGKVHDPLIHFYTVIDLLQEQQVDQLTFSMMDASNKLLQNVQLKRLGQDVIHLDGTKVNVEGSVLIGNGLPPVYYWMNEEGKVLIMTSTLLTYVLK